MGSLPSSLASWRVAALFALPALLLLAACQSEEQAAAEAPRVTVQQLRDDPEAHLGERVTVRGTVARVYGASAFSIAGDAGSVLVVFIAPSAEVENARSEERPLAPGDTVHASGTARRFASAVTERDAEQEVEIDYADENPALVATRLVRAPLDAQ